MTEIEVNNVYEPLLRSNTRYILLYGGRAGGRSHAASQKIILDTKHNKYSRIAIMRYILGDVRSSVWQEFKDRLEDIGMPKITADQNMHYEFNGNIVDGKGFKKSSSQNTAKLKSLAGYNTVWIEEAEEVSEDDFNNLDSSIRTKKGKNTIILSFNMPNKDHWIIKKWFNLVNSKIKGFYEALPKENQNDTTYIFTTYHDNKRNLTHSLIRTYESFREINPEYYYTMIKGFVSEGVRGRVFPDWKPISNKEYDELPYGVQYGLDFGFTNDPTALVEMKYHNNKIYIKVLIYETGLTNQDIADRINTMGIKSLIVADSAEPKSIEELRREGINIIASKKGKDSVRNGINLLKQFQVYYTEDSVGIREEIQNYVFKLDRDKKPTNEPIDDYNHIIDAFRYVASEVLKKQKVDISWFG